MCRRCSLGCVSGSGHCPGRADTVQALQGVLEDPDVPLYSLDCGEMRKGGWQSTGEDAELGLVSG